MFFQVMYLDSTSLTHILDMYQCRKTLIRRYLNKFWCKYTCVQRAKFIKIVILDAYWKNPQYLIQFDLSYFNDLSDVSNSDDDDDDDDDDNDANLIIALMQKPYNKTNSRPSENEEILEIGFAVFEVQAIWFNTILSWFQIPSHFI